MKNATKNIGQNNKIAIEGSMTFRIKTRFELIIMKKFGNSTVKDGIRKIEESGKLTIYDDYPNAGNANTKTQSDGTIDIHMHKSGGGYASRVSFAERDDDCYLNFTRQRNFFVLANELGNALAIIENVPNTVETQNWPQELNGTLVRMREIYSNKFENEVRKIFDAPSRLAIDHFAMFNMLTRKGARISVKLLHEYNKYDQLTSEDQKIPKHLENKIKRLEKAANKSGDGWPYHYTNNYRIHMK